MLTVLNFYKSTSKHPYVTFQFRNKSKTNWAKLKKKTGPKYKALNHFDDFYGSVFGNQWESMREGLLRKSKYVAIINNYGDAEETMEYLSQRGAHCLKYLMSVQQDFHNEYPTDNIKPKKERYQSAVDNYVSKLQSDEISNIYPEGGDSPEKLEFKDTTINTSKVEDKTEESEHLSKNLDEAIDNAEIDYTRIISAEMGVSSEALYQYIPATKLKGMDDYVPESLHYSFYSSQSGDFPLVIEPETTFKFPEHLKVMTYEMGSELYKFPEPKRSNTGVFNFYPLDGSSVLPVLALCLQQADRVLDLCAAPGGKSLITLQTLLPDVLVCNDSSISRNNRLKNILRSYLIDYESNNKWRERILCKTVDGRIFTDDSGFDKKLYELLRKNLDPVMIEPSSHLLLALHCYHYINLSDFINALKVLVDVPCTTDRHSVMNDENNIFRPDRIKERLRIPELQSQLLLNALKLVKVGGAVVYSTCSLSPIQNDGVVHLALKQAFQANGIVAVVKDMSAPFSSLSSTLVLGSGSALPKYGQLVVPHVEANFGPAYIARLVRVK